MPDGGWVRVATAAAGRDGERLATLTVEDSGTGMDRETLSHIFEPFFTTKSRDHGTGLGLSMVYGAVQQLGGSIAVDSGLGRGSRFRISFPEVAEAPQPPSHTGSVLSRHGALAEGTHFIAKPFAPAELARKLRDLIEK